MSANSRHVTVSRDCFVVGRFSASRTNVPGGGTRDGFVLADSSDSESVALDSELEVQEECVSNIGSGNGSGECCDLSSSEVCSGGVTVGGCGSE